MTALTRIASLPVPQCRCVRVSPDGTSVLTVGAGAVQMWDAASGQLGWSRPWAAMAEFPVEAVWSGGGDTVTLVADARLGLLDAFSGADRPLPDELAGRTDITATALSTIEPTLAVGTQEGIVLLWQQDTGRVLRLRGGGDPVTALAWRPTTNELCVAKPRSLQLWEPANEVMISSMHVGDIHPLRLVWTPDGDLIMVMGLAEVRALSAATRADSAPPLATRGRPTGLGVSRTGATLLVGMPDGSVELLDRRLHRPDVTAGAQAAAVIEAACLHVNDTGLVAVRAGPDSVGLYTLPDTQRPARDQHRTVTLRRWAAGVARSAGGTPEEPPPAPVPTTVARKSGFAWADDGWYRHATNSGRVHRFTGDGGKLWKAEVGTGPMATGAGYVAVGTAGDEIVVLDGTTGTQVITVRGTGAASLSSCGMAVAVPNRRDLAVVDLLGERRARNVPVPDRTGDPCWSPDGTLLAAPTANGVLVWDGESLERLRRLDVGASRRSGVLAFSPDGGYLALARSDGPVAMWNTATWRAEQPTIPSGPWSGEVLAWSPDSRLLAVPAPRPIGAVDLWDVQRGQTVMTIPPAPDGRKPVVGVCWAADGRFAVVHDEGTVVSWTITLPARATGERVPPQQLPALVAATAAVGTMVSVPVLVDLFSLLLGQDAGRLDELSRHPGVTMLRGLRWPADAVVGLAVLVAAGLPAAEDTLPPDQATQEELHAAVEQAMEGVSTVSQAYEPPMAALLVELDRIDDSVIVLATLLGPDAVAAAPDVLARVRSQSFGGWSLAPRQQRLLGLRSMLRADGRSQGHGVGDTRAGIARHGELPSLLPSQLASPREVLAAKMSRDELLFRTRQGGLAVEAQPVVLVVDDTAAAFGTVGVTLRIVANLLAGMAIRQRRRCALVLLGSADVTFLAEMADLVHLWAGGSVERPNLPAALAAAGTAAAQLSDVLGGLPRLVVLTHPYLDCPTRPGLHVIRVHYPGLPTGDPAPRTHVLAPAAGPAEIHEVIGAVLTDRT
ncbi:WD40 repeat domain-containing protein [Actinocrispum wychmicini]|uniref:WD40 repeat protein n=1 Tax=Actinocrispum wychmicini TaxID=1213861 RepID=A0A4V2S5P4_9PSEU|nr:hypothetical protein [Actinocrispum wychmicini]TCO52890.1 WD40 repeat protein [Actinocrispum wychmicini]